MAEFIWRPAEPDQAVDARITRTNREQEPALIAGSSHRPQRSSWKFDQLTPITCACAGTTSATTSTTTATVTIFFSYFKATHSF